MPFAGSPLTAESPEGDFAVLAATSVAGQPGDAQHEFALGEKPFRQVVNPACRRGASAPCSPANRQVRHMTIEMTFGTV